MKINTAIKILKNRAEYYGKTMDFIVSTLDDDFKAVGYYNETAKVVEAYKVYKKGTSNG